MPPAQYPLPTGVKAPWAPATEQQVQELEVKLGARLPEDYRKFLMAVNGIEAGMHNLTLSVYDSQAKKEEVYFLQGLYSLSEDDLDVRPLLEHQRDYSFHVRVPKRFIIIGHSLGEENFCISLSGPDRGHVYYWYPPDVPEGEPLEENSEKWLWHLADSFSEFWSKLRVSTPEDWR